jgi:adenylate kinase family enzyme
MRVFIMGSSGAGKTHLASKLSTELALPHLELDSLRHQANWQALPDHKFQTEVRGFCKNDKWVIDGNYSVVRALVLARATDVVLLDHTKSLVMFRLFIRSMNRVLLRKKLWNGNRERLRCLLSPNPNINVLLWSWRNFDRRRAEFTALQLSVATAEQATLRIHRISNQKQLPELIARLRRIATD